MFLDTQKKEFKSTFASLNYHSLLSVMSQTLEDNDIICSASKSLHNVQI